MKPIWKHSPNASFCLKKKKKGKQTNWISVSECHESHIKLTRNATMFWFCKEKKTSKWFLNIFGICWLSCYWIHTCRSWRLQTPKLDSVFVHYSHNSQKLVIFNGVGLKLTRQKIEQTKKHPLPSCRVERSQETFGYKLIHIDIIIIINTLDGVFKYRSLTDTNLCADMVLSPV